MFVCLSWSMAGQMAGPIETKLDTRTHVHPGSVSGKVNVKVIHVCVRDWQKYETPGMRHLANDAQTTSGGRRRRHLPNDYETPSGLRVIARVTRRAPNSERNGVSRTPSGGRVIRASIYIYIYIYLHYYCCCCCCCYYYYQVKSKSNVSLIYNWQTAIVNSIKNIKECKI